MFYFIFTMLYPYFRRINSYYIMVVITIIIVTVVIIIIIIYSVNVVRQFLWDE